LIISKEKIKEKSGKRKELGRHVLHGFYVCNPCSTNKEKRRDKKGKNTKGKRRNI